MHIKLLVYTSVINGVSRKTSDGAISARHKGSCSGEYTQQQQQRVTLKAGIRLLVHRVMLKITPSHTHTHTRNDDKHKSFISDKSGVKGHRETEREARRPGGSSSSSIFLHLSHCKLSSVRSHHLSPGSHFWLIHKHWNYLILYSFMTLSAQ